MNLAQNMYSVMGRGIVDMFCEVQPLSFIEYIMKLKDVKIGQRFGRWEVVGEIKRDSSSLAWAECLCDCGISRKVRIRDMIGGKSSSCGCLHNELFSDITTTHGLSESPIYRTWSGMIQRCTNKGCMDYKNYGGRGIIVCKEWLSFENFYKDMGQSYKTGLTIDRINNNRNYCKENCRWATRKQQNGNRRDNVKYRGEIAVDAGIRLGGCKGLIFARMNLYGWSKKKAFTTPIGKNRIQMTNEKLR